MGSRARPLVVAGLGRQSRARKPGSVTGLAALSTIDHPDRREANNTVANIKSQKKRNLTNEKARLRNKAVKSSLRTAVRKFNAAAEAGNADEATALAQEASRKLDKAVSKGVIHKNQAANRKSAMAKKAAAL